MLREAFALILIVGAILSPGCSPRNDPVITDLHFHWEGQADLDELIGRHAALGVKLGITGEGGADWGLSNDESLVTFLSELEGRPIFKGLQVYTLDWPGRFSKPVLSKLDYVAADALFYPETDGRIIALWDPAVTFPDANDFMEKYVKHNLAVLALPINIWSNPTYLPESLQSRYDELWTRARMLEVIEAAVRNGVIIEINSKYNIPSLTFLKLAKAAGAKFSFGSNRHDDEEGNLDYCLEMYKACGLTAEHMYVPRGTRVK